MRTCSTCGCRAPLCRECCDAALDQFRGVAALRGLLLGESARTRRPSSPPTEAEAREKVRDLAAGDERLVELLARVCADAAALEYAEPTQRPGGVAFTVGCEASHQLTSGRKVRADLSPSWRGEKRAPAHSAHGMRLS